MKIPTARWIGFLALAAFGGGLGGVGYVIVRYIIGSSSDLPRMFAGLYISGGAVLGCIVGIVAGVLALLILMLLRRLMSRPLATVLAGALAGLITTVLASAIFIALHERFDVAVFLGVLTPASAIYLAGTGLLLLRAAPRPQTLRSST